MTRISRCRRQLGAATAKKFANLPLDPIANVTELPTLPLTVIPNRVSARSFGWLMTTKFAD